MAAVQLVCCACGWFPNSFLWVSGALVTANIEFENMFCWSGSFVCVVFLQCVCACMCMCALLCACVCMHTDVCVCMCVCALLCVCVCVLLCVCVWLSGCMVVVTETLNHLIPTLFPPSNSGISVILNGRFMPLLRSIVILTCPLKDLV